MKNPLSKLFQRRDRDRPAEEKSGRLSPDGLRVTEFPAPVQSMLRLYGIGGSLGAIYASQPNVRTVVDTIAREAADLSIKMYAKDPRGKDLPDARISAGDHRIMQLLDEPTPGMSTFRFWFSLFADIGIYDRAIWRKMRVNGIPKALIRIPPDTIAPVHDYRTGTTPYWRLSDGTLVKADDLVIFWGYDPQVSDGSVAPLETLRRLLAEELAAGKDREGMWRNSARKDGVIEQAVEGAKLDDEARESFLVDVEDALSGPVNSGRPLMLEPGMKWNDVQWSPREIEYVSGRKLNRTEVAAAYHFPPAMVAASDNGMEPDEDTLNFFYTSTLPPYLSRVESDIHAQLLPDFEISPKTRKHYYFEFNLDAKLRGSFEKQAAVMATTAGGPVITLNEARARLNLPPVPGGDVILTPLNSIRGGGPQASPNNPVDTPADLNPAGTTPGGGVTTDPKAKENPEPVPVALSALSTKDLEELLSKQEKVLAEIKNDTRLKARAAGIQMIKDSRVRYAELGGKTMRKFFKRQEDALRGGSPMKRSRWDKELADDIFGVYYQAVSDVGSKAGKILAAELEDDDLEFDPERTANFLRAHAELVAISINDKTDERREKSTKKNPDGDPAFNEDRADGLGGDFGTYGVGWAMYELGRQFSFNLPYSLLKTWFTASRAPRLTHSQINGSSAGWDQEFGNGLLHPGDTSHGPEEGANCYCIMWVENAQRGDG